MTHRSRNGGPPKTHRKQQVNNGQPRKLHHPPPPSAQPGSSSSSSSRHPATSTPSDKEILDVIHSALHYTLTSPDFVPTVQKIKGLLYDAKWLEVFTNPAYLEAYAGRWVPSRALCFRQLFVSLPDLLMPLLDEGDPLRMVSLGGGAGSELLALAALLASRGKVGVVGEEVDAAVSDDEEEDEGGEDSGGEPEAEGPGAAEQPQGKGKGRDIQWIGADIGPWSGVLDAFASSCRTAWAPQMEQLQTQYIEGDLLSPEAALWDRLGNAGQSDPTSPPGPTIVTLLFTLTELLSQSPSRTIEMFRRLTSALAPGALLLVADSASDIASFSLGAERKWPTYTILEMTLERLVRPAGSSEQVWDRVDGDDGQWFRLGEGVGAGWPVKLENTRLWYRLYRRR